MAQAILAMRLAGQVPSVRVGSVGLLENGLPLPAETRSALVRLGIPAAALDTFRSRVIDKETVRRADLVLGLAREHVREVVVLVPEAWPRTFTLKELLRRGEAAGPRRPDEPLEGWLERVTEGRLRSDLLGMSADDDVDDPVGGPSAAFEKTARELQRLCDRLITLLWPR